MADLDLNKIVSVRQFLSFKQTPIMLVSAITQMEFYCILITFYWTKTCNSTHQLFHMLPMNQDRNFNAF